ncbi:MAG TPA: sigma 54-interacting transcriptional regulator [Polyangiaceae bacterium]|jgi:Nif-specific regulatory protein|nr:sigma 54-interacting transcriptional regulator [Polyangiaceae bacterium]
MDSGPPDESRLRLERELYLGLLTLNSRTALEPFLNEALNIMLALAGASQGYLEIFSETDEKGWWTAAGISDEELDLIRSMVSRGIIAEAIASESAVVTPSALLDPRFRDLGSVRRSRIEAVLCAPIGSSPPVGVLYLQGRTRPGTFSEEDLGCAELFGRHLAPLVHRLFLGAREEPDATRSIRQKLEASEIVGRSAAIERLLREVALIAPLDVSVLLTGDTGTGKSHLARVIHVNGGRRQGPLVELNCATIPEPLMESELFGAMPGAHSTASHRMEGRISAAEGGTLVLDEITELSVSAQAKLLQVLQTKEYYPLGSSKPRSADVRLIAATNVDLRAAVEERRFREDLYYRLAVMPIRLPTLAERRDDIELLSRHFCQMAQRRHSLRHVDLSLGALRALRQATYRGNLRELGHIVEAGTIRAAAQDVAQVEASHLFGAPELAVSPTERPPLTFQEETRRFQSELLQSTLETTGYNIAATARRLDLTRSHVYNLIRAFGLGRGRQ